MTSGGERGPTLPAREFRGGYPEPLGARRQPSGPWLPSSRACLVTNSRACLVTNSEAPGISRAGCTVLRDPAVVTSAQPMRDRKPTTALRMVGELEGRRADCRSRSRSMCSSRTRSSSDKAVVAVDFGSTLDSRHRSASIQSPVADDREARRAERAGCRVASVRVANLPGRIHKLSSGNGSYGVKDMHRHQESDGRLLIVGLDDLWRNSPLVRDDPRCHDIVSKMPAIELFAQRVGGLPVRRHSSCGWRDDSSDCRMLSSLDRSQSLFVGVRRREYVAHSTLSVIEPSKDLLLCTSPRDVDLAYLSTESQAVV